MPYFTIIFYFLLVVLVVLPLSILFYTDSETDSIFLFFLFTLILTIVSAFIIIWYIFVPGVVFHKVIKDLRAIGKVGDRPNFK